MGNDTWIIDSIGKSPSAITEIGAGDGILLSKLSQLHPQAKIDAYDLAPRPARLPKTVTWHRGDILNTPPPEKGGVLIANLFLHHFTGDQLQTFSPWLGGFDMIVINEPLRTGLSLFFGRAAYPFFNSVTRHDMKVSIEAGFVATELPLLLGLGDQGFSYSELEEWRGAIRVVAQKSKI